MRVLIACESSGRVREAFRKRGHEAYSCDLKPAEDNSPYHHTGDVLEYLRSQPPFDLVIGHPPCTFLCNSGVRWLYIDGRKANGPDEERWLDMYGGVNFFKALAVAIRENNPNAKIAFENPVMHKHARALVGRQDQCVQPWWFGEEAFKGTCFWLWGLPPLKVTNKLVPPKKGTPEHKRWSVIHNASPSAHRGEDRSRTFQGIADAMAAQWG